MNTNTGTYHCGRWACLQSGGLRHSAAVVPQSVAVAVGKLVDWVLSGEVRLQGTLPLQSGKVVDLDFCP